MAKTNRRIKSRQQRLDGRRRLVRSIVQLFLRLVLLAGIGIGIGFAGVCLVDFVQTAPVLSVRCIEINGLARATSLELRQLAKLQEGQNIFSIDLDKVTRDLEFHPWVKRAYVSRQVPDRIVIEIVEHQPVALVHLENLYLVDDEGEVFKRLQVGESIDLPVITGLDRDRFRQKPDQVEESILQALVLARSMESDPCLVKQTLGEVHVDELMGYTVVLDPGAISVRLGHQAQQRLGKLCQVIQELQRRNLSARSILLDHADRPHRATIKLGLPGVQTSKSNRLERS